MPGDAAVSKVHCLRTGVAREKAGRRGLRRYLVDDWSPETLPVNVFLVEHADGLCLFDCGQTAKATHRGYLPQWHPFLRLSRFELDAADEAGAQLERRGIDPARVRWVVLSHLHTDHVGGLDAFADAEILVTETEWRLAAGWAGRVRGYVPQHWPRAAVPSLVEFSGPPVGPFAGSFDVAGDGRLLLVPTPGHTRGHMAMLVQGAEGAYLLCGDLVHAPNELETTHPTVAKFCQKNDVTVLATHDPRAAALLV